METFLDSIWKHGERTALVESNGNKTSYQELKQKVDVLSSQFSDFPSLAILICKNTCVSLMGYLSCFTRGVVPLLLSSKISNSIIKKYISVYHPKYLFLDFSYVHEAYEEIMVIEDFFLYVSKDTRVPKINSQLRLLLTTSGSTGNPKLVRLSDENLRINTEMICNSLPIRADDIAITTLPFNYSYGLSIINTHLLRGCTIQLNEFAVVQRAFWELLYQSKATTFGGVPFLYEQIKHLGLEKILKSNVRYLTQAGGKLSKTTLNEIYKICDLGSIEFFVMYGQTEASARISILNPSDSKKHPGSIGKAISPGELWLSPVTTAVEASNHEIGELVYRGGNVALGYAESEDDLALGDEWKGVLKTGDLGYFDNDGFPYILGRISRFSKIRGIRISLDDIESAFGNLNFHIFALEVNDVPHLVSTEVIESKLLDQILRESFKLSLLDFKHIQVSSIPLAPSGKVDYQALSQTISSMGFSK